VPPVDTDVPSHVGCVTALRAVAVCWVAGLLPARPTGMRGGPAYQAAAWLGTRETKLV